MIDLVLYLLFGSLVIRFEKPVQFAGGFAVLSSLFSLVLGVDFIGALFLGTILFGYTAFVYMVVDRYADRIVLPIAILFAGALVWIGASVYVT